MRSPTLRSFKVMRLTLFVEGGLVIHHDDSLAPGGSFTLIWFPLMDVISPPARLPSIPATTGPPPPGLRPPSRDQPDHPRPATTLESLELFRGDAINSHGRHLLVGVGGAAHKDVVADFQIFQCEFLRLLCPSCRWRKWV